MKQIVIILLTLIFLASPTHAQERQKLDVDKWATLPVLHEGRVKPLNSFAQVMLKTLSNKTQVAGLNANEWLALSIFSPVDAINIPVFKIREAEKFGLKPSKEKLYSYTDLSAIIQTNQNNILSLIEKNPEELSEDQKYLIELYEHYILYTQILRSLTLILPLQSEGGENNFLDYKKRQHILDQQTKDIIAKKGTNLENYSDEEREIAFLSYQLNTLESAAQNNVLLRLLPADWNNKDGEWVSLWAIIQQGKGSPQSAEYIEIWQDLAQAYQTQNQANWDQEVTNAQKFFNNPKLKTEKIYNTIDLLHWALAFYCFAFLMLLIKNLTKSNLICEKFSFGFLSAGTIAHLVHILLRVYILSRPPVGTLYESILFVSLICVAGFLFLSWKQKKSTGILLGSVSGILLLTTSQGFVSEDTMGTLVAVLNTNFWLGTHVLCITIGYATCFIVSLMAHYDLALRAFKPLQIDRLTQNFSNLKTMLILSLLFTTIGTILGGVWADQSWGRFWGWDPKENGALLIVLWLAWLLHGRISQHISEIGFIIGAAFLSIVVVLAWFGVNLLNVGLHSYGFITGVAAGIGLFCLLEITILGGLWYLIKRKQHEI